MLDASLQRILGEIPDDAVVLDVGGGTKPLARANWVMDALGYHERGEHGQVGGGPARFTAETWVRRDFCARAPWPFADDQVDFAVCSHTLEDVRDPVWMCEELSRVAKAGYIEVPSRLEEQTYGFQGPWTGWSHHRWLVDVDQPGARITFVHKPHLINSRTDAYFPPDFRNRLTAEERVQTLWWQGGFQAEERLFWDLHEFDAYVAGFVEAELTRRELARWELTPGWRARLGRLRRRARR